MMTKRDMPETMYRASRCCRVLGNPTAYLILRHMGKNRITPGELAERMQMPLTTISVTLRNLRQLDIVRYETMGTSKEYWIKQKDIVAVLDALEGWVESMRRME